MERGPYEDPAKKNRGPGMHEPRLDRALGEMKRGITSTAEKRKHQSGGRGSCETNLARKLLVKKKKQWGKHENKLMGV